MSYSPYGLKLIGFLKGADLNTTADQAIPMLVDKWQLNAIKIYNASTSLAGGSAQGGIYTAPSKGGTAIVGATQVYTANTGGTSATTLITGAVLTTYFTDQTLYLSLTTANGSPATCDIAIFGFILP